MGEKKTPKKKGGGLQATPDISEQSQTFGNSKLVPGRLRNMINVGIFLLEKGFGEKETPTQKGGGLKATPDISESKVGLCPAVITNLGETGYSSAEKQISQKMEVACRPPPNLKLYGMDMERQRPSTKLSRSMLCW